MTRNAAVRQTDEARPGRSAAALKILVLTPQFPYPPHQGTTIRNYNLIAYLAERHAVHLLSFGDPAQSQDTPLHSLCRSVQVVRPPQRAMRQRLTGLFLSRLPDMAQRLPSAQFRAALAATLEREDPDVVQVEGIELAQYLFQAAAEPAVRAGSGRCSSLTTTTPSTSCSSEPLRPTSGRPRRWIGAAYSFVQWQRLRDYERRACLAADRVVAVSETDAVALRQLEPGLSPAVVPNGVDMAFYTAPSPTLDARQAPGPRRSGIHGQDGLSAERRRRVVVCPGGAATTPPSRARTRGFGSSARIPIHGWRPWPTIQGWWLQAGSRMCDPTSPRPGVYVVPLRIGGGTRLKVLEAMAMGKAIVSTRLGCEGFDLAPDQELAIADTPAEFVSAVLALLGDAGRREQMGRAARRFAESRYDWSAIGPRLEKVYAESCGEAGRENG